MIPHIFHWIWFGPKPLPDKFAGYLATWLRHHPDWQVYFWHERERFMLQNEGVFNSFSCLSCRSCVMRYEVIYRYGGVYLDCDFECFGNIEHYLLGRDILFSREDAEVPGWLADSVFAAAPKHPFIKHLIDRLPQSVESQSGIIQQVSTGFLSREYAAWEPKFPIIENTRIFFPFFPFRDEPYTIRWPETVAAHHFAGSWRTEPYGYQKKLQEKA